MMRPCLECGTPVRNRSRCVPCESARYGQQHRSMRDYWQLRLDLGCHVACWRCGAAIDPERWDLGHTGDTDDGWLAPECYTCNRGTRAGWR